MALSACLGGGGRTRRDPSLRLAHPTAEHLAFYEFRWIRARRTSVDDPALSGESTRRATREGVNSDWSLAVQAAGYSLHVLPAVACAKRVDSMRQATPGSVT